MYELLEDRITDAAVSEWLLDLCHEVARNAGVEIDDPSEHLPAAREVLESLLLYGKRKLARGHLQDAINAIDDADFEYDCYEHVVAKDDIARAAQVLGIEKL